VLHAGSSLRGAAATLATFVQQGWADFAVPAFSTIRSWLLRVGYHALTRPLDKSQPWLWLVDHTIQIGSLKLLVILGCPMSQVPFGERALQLSDLQLVALVPMEKSNGDLVEIELENAARRTGVPRQIASDSGSDLKKGIADYCELRPQTTWVPDVAHVGANLLEQAWSEQPHWQKFIEELQFTSSKLRQTKSAFLLAPRMRSKARFMNVSSQLRFAQRVLNHLASESPCAKAVEHYGWLKEYRDDLTTWTREHKLVQVTIDRVRVQGLHSGTVSELESVWGEMDTRASTVRIAAGLRAYVTRYAPRTAGERFVASTEIVESSFGKLKRIEGQQSGDGLTVLSLAMGAMVGVSSEPEIRDALESTPHKQVDRWAERMLGHSVQWLRRQFLGAAKS